MRPFPRTLRRRPAPDLGLLAVGVSMLVVAGAVVGVGTSQARADDLEDDQRQVRRQLAQAHDDLDESSARTRRAASRLEVASAQLTSARAELAAAQARVETARARDVLMQQRLDAAIDRLQQARSDVADGRAALEEQRDGIASMISSIYQEGDPELLAFTAILNSQTAADLTRQMEARSVIVGSETRAYDELRAAEVLLTVREEQVEEAKAEIADRRREAAENLAQMRAAEQEAAAAETSVASWVTESRQAKASAQRARAADLRQLRELEREQERIRQLLAAQAQGSGPVGNSDGFLDYPSGGPVTSGFGYRVHPIYGYTGLHDGTDFGAACGSALYAAAGGSVLSSYWSDVYGNRLVLGHGVTHGVGLATIYNHATSYTVGVGQRVRRGQVIGYVGSTGWSTGCHLHFTVMANGTAVDPMGWL